jgi:hypothetical protein
MASIDVSEILKSSTPIVVDVDHWQNLLSQKDLLPNASIHIGDKFVSLKNEDGEHIISIGFTF